MNYISVNDSHDEDDSCVQCNFDHPSASDAEVKVTFFENTIPSLLENEINSLYGSFFSSPNKLRLDGQMERVSSCVMQKNGVTLAIFLFRLENGRVQVLNEVIKVNTEEVQCFSEAVFRRFKDAAVISFKAVETNLRTLGFPFQRFNYLEDIVLTLPDSIQDYLGSLGNSTRRDIKHKLNKIKKNFASFDCKFFCGENGDEHSVREIVRLHLVRMKNKNKTIEMDESEVNKLLAKVKQCGGFICVATIDDRVCGGLINFNVGKNYFMSMIAHDPKYNNYSLGMICCYLTISECIRRGGNEFHFLWGQGEYKYRLSGIERKLDNLHIYRSSLQFLFYWKTALLGIEDMYMRKAKSILTRRGSKIKILLKIIKKALGRWKND